MFRNLIGFAIFAVVAMFAIKLIFGLFGFVVSLFMALLWFAFVGFVIYLILRLVAPGTADKVKEMINGKKAA